MSSNYTSAGTCNPGPLGPSLAEMCHTSAFVVFMSHLEKMIRSKENISGVCERVESIDTPDNSYDFVVIGGGGAGCAVAGRLSEIPDWKVLLIEAGDDEPMGAKIPMFTSTLSHTRVDWNFTSSNESYACLQTKGSCSLPSGKCLGGSTSHNGMKYIRGNPTDYDNWAALGNKGWAWEDVKPFYLKGENNGEIERVGRTYHATGGPVQVERFPYSPDFADSILAAAKQIRYGITEDPNGEQLTGFTRVQATNKHGVRHSSAAAYLSPAKNRKNLHVLFNSQATRVIIKKNTTTGVEYYQNGVLKRVSVRREVVVSGGTVMSPHILLHSGIGPKEHLESVGVKLVKDMPGVGKNLHDHVTNMMFFTINSSDSYNNNYDIADQYIASQTGPLSSFGLSQIMAQLTTNLTTPDYPDVQIYFNGYDAACAPGEADALRSTGLRTIVIRAVNLHPKCRGQVSLASNDPLQYPVIWVNYLCDPTDVERVVKVTQMALALTRTEALQAHNFTLTTRPLEACSNYTFLTDEYWACAVHQGDVAERHLVGSCKMGPACDPLAVVDHQLRVRGINRLRVADAAVMPYIISGNTAAPSMMIGERAADFIKKYWSRH